MSSSVPGSVVDDCSLLSMSASKRQQSIQSDGQSKVCVINRAVEVLRKGELGLDVIWSTNISGDRGRNKLS